MLKDALLVDHLLAGAASSHVLGLAPDFAGRQACISASWLHEHHVRILILVHLRVSTSAVSALLVQRYFLSGLRCVEAAGSLVHGRACKTLRAIRAADALLDMLVLMMLLLLQCRLLSYLDQPEIHYCFTFLDGLIFEIFDSIFLQTNPFFLF